ncbi:hypothetical protein AgCh_011475 [Apium graveolens]
MVLALWYTIQIEYPENVHLIRGNHEAADINALFGFHLECIERMGENDGIWAWTQFNQLFNYIPLAALIEKKIICMHGENDSVEGLRPNARGPGLVTFGDDNHLDCLVSKIKIVQLPLNAAMDTKLATIAICDYFYDMLYFVPFSTFLKPPQGNQQSYTSILYGMLTTQRFAPATKDVATLKKMNATVGYCRESFHKLYMINALGFDSANIKKYTSTHDYAKALKTGEIAGISLEFASAKVFLAQYLYYNLKSPLFWLHVFIL